MARITFDDIENSIAENYENTIIELPDGELVLRAPLRMPKTDRDALQALQDRNAEKVEADKLAAEAAKEAGDEDYKPEEADVLEFYRSFLTIVSDSKPRAKSFLDKVGDDIGFLQEVVSIYSEALQVGEASPSES